MSDTPGKTGADHQGKAPSGRDTQFRVELYPNNTEWAGPDGNKRNITNFISGLTIEEGLTSSSLFATLTIRDGVNLIDDMRIAGNERIDIEIIQDPEDQSGYSFIKTKHTFYISDVVNFSRNLQVQTYQLLCVSETAYLNNLEFLVGHFKADVGMLVENILGYLKVDKKDKIIQRGGGVIEGIYPNIRPIDAINWLKRNAHDGFTPFYFFESLHYEDLDYQHHYKKGGLVFASYKKFIDQTIYPKYTFSPIGDYKDFVTSQERILKISTNLGMSKFNQIPKGAYGSKFIGVDIATKKVVGEKIRYQYQHKDKLNAFKPFAEKGRARFKGEAIDKYAAKRFYSSLNSLAFEGTGKNYNSNLEGGGHGLMHSTAIKENLNYLSHTIDVEGNFKLWAGKIIEIEIPKAADLEHIQGAENMRDEILSGKFIITRLVHTFKNSEYIMRATCSKDSSMISLDSSPPIPNQ